MRNGAFQLARCTFESDIRMRKPSRRFKVWVFIIWKCNHGDTKQFKRGQCRLTYDIIYEWCRLKNEKVKKSAIDNLVRRLKWAWNLTTRKTTRGFVVTVVNYDKYQDFKNYWNDRSNETQTKHKRNTNDTITEEWKEWEELKEDTFNKFWKLYPRKDDKKKAKEKWDIAIKSTPPEQIIQWLEKYNDEITINWTEKRYIKQAKTRLHNESRNNEYEVMDDDFYLQEFHKMSDNWWAEFKLKYWEELYRKYKPMYKERRWSALLSK